MTVRSIAALCATCTLFASCSTLFVVSTLNTTSNHYTPQPVKTGNEPNKSETYLGLQVSPGINVESLQDIFSSFDLRLAQGHAFGRWRASYSSSLMLGSFYAEEGYNRADDTDVRSYRQRHGGHLFCGAVGGNATLSYAIPIRTGRGEWRVIGLQGSAFKEFGKYLEFRKNMPAEFDLGVERTPGTYTAGFFSEWVRETGNGRQFGFKFGGSLGFYQAFQKVFNREYDYFVDHRLEDEIPRLPYYFSLTHFQRIKRMNGYVQLNTGTATTGIQFGVLYTLGKNRE